MEIINTNDENSFDSTPRLKSSPIPIKFISFNVNDIKCVYCGERYFRTLFCYWQKYCKTCLSRYINDITDNIRYLDVHYAMDLECSEHEINRTKVQQSIQESCGNCVRILCFKQIKEYNISYCGTDKNISTLYNKVIESEKNCKLCRKSLYQGTDREIMKEFKLCSDCYIISSELIESTLVKKQISILYLPWWYNNVLCDICFSELTFTSDCQKYCASCFIFCVGCRYCLIINILFGPTDQSQCKKCKRISPINSGIDDFLFNNNLVTFDNLDYLKLTKFENIIVKNINKYFVPWRILNSIFREQKQANQNEWIPYSQFKDVREITRGGYGIIYIATWLNKNNKNKTVILKRFENSKNIGKYFLNELQSYYHCFKDKKGHIIETYGFTKDPELEDYILVMKYASGGDLHKYLQRNFASITWNKEKLRILYQISVGLETIHNENFIHRDFHSGNILFDPKVHRRLNDNWKIGDLGLSQAVNSKSSNNEIYGVIPYIAPEIFRGSIFSKEADIYSFGMVMWELTTGCKPFDNVDHDHTLIYKILDGERPKITEDTPECYVNLMKSCWDADPKKRPSIKDIRLTFGRWIFRKVNEEEFEQAEEKRKKLIESKKIGPEFAEKRHLGAIYTGRTLSTLISKCSSVYSLSTISFDSDYISELENDTDVESLSSQNLNSVIQKFPTTLDSRYISAELEFDINTESLSLQNLNSTIQNYSTTLDPRYISAELELDINTESFLSQNLSSTIQNLDSRYTSAELELNINTENLSLQNLNSTIQNYSTTLDPRYISAELELDINTESFLSQNPSSTIQNLDSRYTLAELELNINTESLSLQNLNSTIQNYSTTLDPRYISAELELDINTESSTIQNYSTALDSRHISAELELDINTESLSSQNLSSTLQNYSTALDCRYIPTELELDINTESLSSQNLNSTIQNFLTSLKKRRNEELLNDETHDDNGNYLSGSVILFIFVLIIYINN
ncbi:unnamed protein product [Rhizophagus irregularis]|nr:unnamed protein product [Rhizophagus irregularis]